MTSQRQLRDFTIRGFRLERSVGDVALINISPGVCMDDQGETMLELPVLATVDSAVSGVGGIDDGVLTNNTWYSIWVVQGTSGTDVLASKSQTSPTLPAGFDSHKRRIGWVRRVSAAVGWRWFKVSLQGSARAYMFADTGKTSLYVLADYDDDSFTTVDCTDFIPPGQIWGLFNLYGECITTGFGCRPIVRANGKTVSDNSVGPTAFTRTSSSQRDADDTMAWIATDSGRLVQCRVNTSSSSTNIWVSVIGFMDEVELGS